GANAALPAADDHGGDQGRPVPPAPPQQQPPHGAADGRHRRQGASEAGGRRWGRTRVLPRPHPPANAPPRTPHARLRVAPASPPRHGEDHTHTEGVRRWNINPKHPVRIMIVPASIRRLYKVSTLIVVQ
ncbi:hypothetical protein AVEN_146141-1, partial [Araneus ventricosus]